MAGDADTRPVPGLPGPRSGNVPLPQLYGEGGAGHSPWAQYVREGGSAPAATPPQNGEVTVRVDIANLPPGSKVDTKSTGIASPPETNVGYASPVFAY